MQAPKSKKIVAIVGRPNVGKSSLFNRLIGRRLSIVHEESGVTRDRVSAEASWDDTRFELIDTGGLGTLDQSRTHNVFEKGTIEQVHMAIEDASVIIFVVDVTEGIVPLDQEVARILHTRGCHGIIAVNKTDNTILDKKSSEFSSLAFPLYPISAIHNRGIGDLMSRVLETLPDEEDPAEVEALKVAVVGKPNAGKSSYINRLLRHERVIVSEISGTTRDSIDIPFSVGTGSQARHYVLTDTAGLRRRGKVDTIVEHFSHMRAEKSIEKADVAVLVLDAEKGPGANDKKIARMVLEKRKGCLLLLNKWDLSEVTQRAYAKALKDSLPFLQFVPLVFVSSKTGYNIRRSIDAIDYVASQVRTHLSTGVLNRILHGAFNRVPPPLVGRRRLKLYYVTQTGTQPIRIRLFVNNSKRVTSTYRSYLVNVLRSSLGLEGAPIVLQLCARKKE